MGPVIVRAFDVLALASLGALIAALAWLVLDTVRQMRSLDDPPASRWPETPGARTDRTRLMEDRAQ